RDKPRIKLSAPLRSRFMHRQLGLRRSDCADGVTWIPWLTPRGYNGRFESRPVERNLMLRFINLKAIALALLAGTASLLSAQTAAYRAPRFVGTPQPNLNGIWQANNTANWDLEDHSAAPGPMWETGAIGSVPAGRSVVEGGSIPYSPAGLAKKK